MELGEDEASAVRLFLAMALQWRFHGFSGQRLGLEYAAVRPTADGLGMVVTPPMFADLRTMESAAMAVFAESRR